MPLHLATYHGHPAVIDALLDAGAALEAQFVCTVNGEQMTGTAIHVAVREGHVDCAKALIRRKGTSAHTVFPHVLDTLSVVSYAHGQPTSTHATVLT